LTAAAGIPPAAPGGSAGSGTPEAHGSGKSEKDTTAAPAEGRIRLQFTSPTKPALITGSPGMKGAGEVRGAIRGESAPDYRYLVVPLRALASG
jgi:hypothetical protein